MNKSPLGKVVWDEYLLLGDDRFNVIAYHPWMGEAVWSDSVFFYSPELGMYTENILSMTLVLVAYKSLGYHSPELVAGICRMLNIDDPSVQRSKA
jgi:hypothetical protein